MTASDWPRYRIRIRGHLDPVWSAWFDGLGIAQQADGTTTLTGHVVDQAELFGLLARRRRLGEAAHFPWIGVSLMTMPSATPHPHRRLIAVGLVGFGLLALSAAALP